MENRLRLSLDTVEDEYRRHSFASSVVPQRGSAVPAPSRDFTSLAISIQESENVFDTPPGSPTVVGRDDVFATPTHSQLNSANVSLVDLSDFSTRAPSEVHRSSISSEPRSLSSLTIADGGWSYGFGGHRRSVSLSRSITPSLSVTSGASGLHRSNTATSHGTSNSSTLYSIPSNISGISSPPSPRQVVAPVRPQFNYGGHQQTLSINGSEVDESDPFGDGFEIPVGDGFRPHTHSQIHNITQRPPTSSAVSHNGSFGSLPPPYTEYTLTASPKPEGDEIDLGVVVRPVATNSDSGISMGDGDVRRRSGRNPGVALAAAVGVGHTGNADSGEDTSGATKEWREKRIFGSRVWLIILSGAVALLVGIAVGLGVGLGIGAAKSKADSSGSGAIITTATNSRPSPEETSPPKSDPNNEYPDIPTGKNMISPIELKDFHGGCNVASGSTQSPQYFSQGSNGLWSCNIPEQRPLLWDIEQWPMEFVDAELSKLGTVPDTIVCAEFEYAKWGGYLITSQEGEFNEERKNTVFVSPNGESIQYAPGGGFREGMQAPAFYNQPLAFMNITWFPDDSIVAKREAGPITTYSYKFGMLYNKTVILKETTMIETFNSAGANPQRYGNGTELVAGEKVWMCTWDKTLLEVELMVDEYSRAALEKQPTKHALGSNDDDKENDTDNGDTKTTITITDVLPTSSTTVPSSFRSERPPRPPGKPSPGFHHGRPPPPPPPPPTSTSTPTDPDDFVFIERLVKRSSTKPRRYSRKVIIKEYRPTRDRLRRVLGIDRTDVDPEGQAVPGAVHCRKMIVQADRGLREYNSEAELVKVTMREVDTEAKLKPRHTEGRDIDSDDENDGCRCKWES